MTGSTERSDAELNALLKRALEFETREQDTIELVRLELSRRRASPVRRLVPTRMPAGTRLALASVAVCIAFGVGLAVPISIPGPTEARVIGAALGDEQALGLLIPPRPST